MAFCLPNLENWEGEAALSVRQLSARVKPALAAAAFLLRAYAAEITLAASTVHFTIFKAVGWILYSIIQPA